MECKVLVIGTYQIGRDAIRNLLEIGINNIEIMDMDTSDVSQLTQQFKKDASEHIGKLNAAALRDFALQQNQNAKIVATNYGHSFFRKFDLILNALDNRLDRDEVNSMCSSINVPCIDCYECASKVAIDPIPSKIIEEKPTELAHCLIWAKRLFNELFSAEVTAETDKELAILLNHLTYEVFDKVPNVRALVENSNFNAETIFNKVFNSDIQDIVSTAKPSTSSNDSQPIPLKYTNNSKSAELPTWEMNVHDQYKIHSEMECEEVFTKTIDIIREKITKTGEENCKILRRAIVDFLMATTNLRAFNYRIPKKIRRWEILFNLTVTLNEISLFDMANEVLENIFSFMDDQTLLNSSRTCKHFRVLAERAFDRKYANEFYVIQHFQLIDEMRMHRAILLNFGDKLKAVTIIDADLTDDHRWILNLMLINGAALQKLCLHVNLFEETEVNLREVFMYFPNLRELSLDGYSIEENDWAHIHMPYLKRLELYNIYDVEIETLNQFFDNNRQIEHLVSRDNEIDLVECANNRLHNLKHLQISEIPEHFTTVHLKSLVTLEIRDNADVDRILRVFHEGCETIKELSLEYSDEPGLDEVTISTICMYKQLTSLEITADEITLQHLQTIERQLTKLKNFTIITEIDVVDAENHQLVIDEMLSIISNTKYLNKLELTINTDCSKRIDAEFHCRFIEAIGKNRPEFVIDLTLEGRRTTKHLLINKQRIVDTECDGKDCSVHELLSPTTKFCKTMADANSSV